MRVGPILIGFFAALISTYGVVWLVHQKPKPPTQEAATPQPTGSDEDEDRPAISPTGPHPKIMLDEASTFEFDRMEVGEKRSHTFTVHNLGEADLVLKKGPTTCHCTMSELTGNKIPPGEKTEITLTWEPVSESEEFAKGADIYSNDPAKPEFTLSIKGVVTTRLAVFPGNTWPVAQFREDGDSEVIGAIASPIVEDFKITGIECEKPYISAEKWEKIEDRAKLKEMQMLCGYEVHVKVSPTMPVGAFAIRMHINTDVLSNAELKEGETERKPLVKTVMITGNRRGPIRISGPQWVENYSCITMGQFSRQTGKSIKLKLVAKHPPAEGLKFVELETDPKALRVSIEPDGEANATYGRYLVTVEYPPGMPLETRNEKNPATIRIRTNHLTAPEMKWDVLFNAH